MSRDIVMMYHVSNKFLNINYNLALKLGYFHFSVSCSTLLTTCLLLIFASNESSLLSILSIDLSLDSKVIHGVK